MKPLVLALLASIAIGAGTPAQDTGPRTRAIAGQVVDAVNGLPLRRARVMVSAGETRVDAIFTDDRGQFTVSRAPASALVLRTSKAGYAASFSPVPANDTAALLRVALVRSGAVTGRVLDPAGGPEAGAFVTGRMIVPPSGRSAPAARQFFTQSDPLGEYRLGGLPPGRYQITAARIPPGSNRENGKLDELLFGPPESLDPARDSVEIVLAPGDEVRDVEFHMRTASRQCPIGPSVRPVPGAVTGTIQGRVMAASGEALACAIVRTSPTDLAIPSVYTDSQGQYSLQGLPEGTFVLEARMQHYGPLLFGQRRRSDEETAVSLRQGERRADVDFVLTRQGTISGTVRDEHGEPVEGVVVLAFRTRQQRGRLTTIPSQFLPGQTDDRGQYRLIGLDPGEYLVTARAPGALSTQGAERPRGYAAVYYPSTLDVPAAVTVPVDVGRDADGIDLTLIPTPTSTLTGRMVDTAGRPLAGTVSWYRRNGHETRSVPTTDGTFEFRDLTPGDYVIQAQRRDGPVFKFGVQQVEVGDGDLPPLTIAAAEQATVDGRVIAEGSADAEQLGVLVSVEPAEADTAPLPGSELDRNAGASSTLKEGGRFHVSGVSGPTRFVITASSCETCYVKSVYVNGTDATDTPFDFGLKGGAFEDVQIILSDDAGSIEGHVMHERNRPVRTFVVVVFPLDRDLWFPKSRHVKSALPMQDGSFRVSGLPPADYLVVAVNRLDRMPVGGDLSDPDVLEQLSSDAQRVRIGARDRRTITLPLVSRQPSR